MVVLCMHLCMQVSTGGWVHAQEASAGEVAAGTGGVAVVAMGLTNCVAYAQEHSRDLRERELAWDRQVLTTYINRGAFRTSLGLSGDWDPEEDDGSGRVSLTRRIPWGADFAAAYRSNFDESTETSATLSLTISKTILGGGSRAETMLDVDNSMIDELIRGNRVAQKRRELVYQVSAAYYNVIRSRQTLKVRQMRLERARHNAAVALERENPLDIANAELEIPEAETRVLQAQREIASALDRLKLVMGMAISEPLEVGDEIGFVPGVISPEDDLAYCLENHEELVNAGLEQHKLENSYLVQQRRVWPEVRVGAVLEERADSGEGIGNGEQGATLQASLGWELGSRSERARTEQGRLDLASRDIQTLTLQQARMAGVRDLARRLIETLRSVENQERGLELAQRRVDLYADRWENGEIDILEYQRSQVSLEDARIELINLKSIYMERLAEYIYETGR